MSDGCFSCSGRCCYDIIVPVSFMDIGRLVRAQGLAPDEIVEPWKERTPTASGIAIDDTDDRYLPILQRNPREPAACAFLVHVADEIKRCGMYADRPEVCRVYPFTMASGALDRRDDARCAPGDWNLATLDYRRRREEHEAFNAERSAHEIVARSFANVPRVARETSRFARFLAYGEAVYDRIANEWPRCSVAPFDERLRAVSAAAINISSQSYQF